MTQLSKSDAIKKLKEAKEHLDLELISQEEYDDLKNELKHLIISSDKNEPIEDLDDNIDEDLEGFDYSKFKGDNLFSVKGPFLWMKIVFGLIVFRSIYMVKTYFMIGDEASDQFLLLDILINAPIVLGLFSRKPWGYYALQLSFISLILLFFITPYSTEIETAIMGIATFTMSLTNIYYFSNRKGYWGIKEKKYPNAYFTKIDLKKYELDDNDKFRFQGECPLCHKGMRASEDGISNCLHCKEKFNVTCRDDILIPCPECDTTSFLPRMKSGRKVKINCKSCSHSFKIKIK